MRQIAGGGVIDRNIYVNFFRREALAVILRLSFEQVRVLAAMIDEFVMGATFNNFPTVQDINLVDHLYGRQTMTDENSRFPLHESVEPFKNLVFRFCVHEACGFIQNYDLGIPQKCSGQSDFLPLANTELLTIFKPL